MTDDKRSLLSLTREIQILTAGHRSITKLKVGEGEKRVSQAAEYSVGGDLSELVDQITKLIKSGSAEGEGGGGEDERVAGGGEDDGVAKEAGSEGGGGVDK